MSRDACKKDQKELNVNYEDINCEDLELSLENCKNILESVKGDLEIKNGLVDFVTKCFSNRRKKLTNTIPSTISSRNLPFLYSSSKSEYWRIISKSFKPCLSSNSVFL